MEHWNTYELDINFQGQMWNFSDLVRGILHDRGIEREQIASIVPFRRLGNHFHVIVLYRLKIN